MRCARADCAHPRATHVAGGCRIGKCPCTGFDDGRKRPAGPRRISIEIPEGYVLAVTLMPIVEGGPGEGELVLGESGPETFVPDTPGAVRRFSGNDEQADGASS